MQLCTQGCMLGCRNYIETAMYRPRVSAALKPYKHVNTLEDNDTVKSPKEHRRSDDDNPPGDSNIPERSPWFDLQGLAFKKRGKVLARPWCEVAPAEIRNRTWQPPDCKSGTLPHSH